MTLNVLHNPGVSGRIPFVVDADSMPNKYYAAVQSWVVCFLTKKGSRPLDVDYGTYFLKKLEKGDIRTEADVLLTFNDANKTCLTYCKRSDGELYVTNAYTTDYDIVSTDSSKYLVIYIAFKFSDGTMTRTHVQV